MTNDSGYCDCSCRDCFDVAITSGGPALCGDCEDAGCDVDGAEDCARCDLGTCSHDSCAANDADLGVDTEAHD